jgi:hypothetical protein
VKLFTWFYKGRLFRNRVGLKSSAAKVSKIWQIFIQGKFYGAVGVETALVQLVDQPIRMRRWTFCCHVGLYGVGRACTLISFWNSTMTQIILQLQILTPNILNFTNFTLLYILFKFVILNFKKKQSNFIWIYYLNFFYEDDGTLSSSPIYFVSRP